MIRPVQAAELDRCLFVIRESFGTVARQFGLTAQNAATNAAFMQPDRLRREFESGTPMLALLEDGEILGFVQLRPRGGGEWSLEHLAVLPEHRHRGHGRALLDAAADLARQNGGTRLTLGMIEENAVLKRWYEDCGFTGTGTKTFPHLPFTVGYMAYEL